MTVTRILFLAKYRIPHACISLQYDHNLLSISKTIIVSPEPKELLWQCFRNHNIDTDNFVYLPDREFLPKYPQIDHWLTYSPRFGTWLRQQALKLSVLDYLDYEVALIQDPDTFLTRPWCCWENEMLNFMVLENTTHSRGYYEVLPAALGIQRQTPHCFITELVPCLKQDITSARQQVERLHKRNWLDAIIDCVPWESTFSQEYPNEETKWFSEYEFIGNWTMSQRSVNMTFQKRFEFKNLESLGQLTAEYNAVADAIPFANSFQMNWDTLQVKNFAYYQETIKNCLT